MTRPYGKYRLAPQVQEGSVSNVENWVAKSPKRTVSQEIGGNT